VLTCRFATGADYELMQQLTLKEGQGITGWVARNRRPLVNARPSADLEAAGSTLPTTLQSALVCPLILGDGLIGTLAVYHTTPSYYRDDHRRLLDRVCEQAAAVIHNAIVFEQTHEASLTDPLTNLPNTRFMVNHLARELSRADRVNAEVSLLVMDLNDFKDINDTFGHHVGDRALREVAQVLRGTIRPYDVCVRYAGDEFIVVLSGCGADEAERKRLELKRAMEDVVFEVRPGRRLPLSISVGAAIYPHDGETYEALLATGDARMYRDKTTRQQLARPAGGMLKERRASGLRRPAMPPEISDLEIERARAGVL
jgi:diguanylate cyclase (GGDEF)-like protein